MATFTAELTAVSSTGFSLTTRDAGAAAFYVGFMLFGDEENASVDDTAVPSSTGTKSWEGPGFKPDFILTFQSGMEAYQTGTTYSTNESLWYSIGVADASASGSVGAFSLDGAATMVCSSRQSTDIIAGPRTSYSDDVIATFTSFDDLGYNFNYSAIDGSAAGDLGFTLAMKFEPDPRGGALFFGAGV